MHERAFAGMIGLLIGDAVGVPYEFHGPEALPPLDAIEMEPPPGFARAHAGVPPGSWSDDGSQALALWNSLMAKGGLDLDDFADRMLAWFHTGRYAVGGKVFDIGIQTRRAFSVIASGTPAAVAGGAGEYDNGNGSLMRVLPLALWHSGPNRNSDSELAELARRSSLPTHGHLRSQLCCALYVLWARREMEGHADAWGAAVTEIRSIYRGDEAAKRELDKHIEPERPPGGKGSGYVVDCLHSARWALTQPSFAGVIKAAISLGSDTDTTAAVAGGIAGLRFGLEGIPEAWKRGLGGKDILAEVLGRSL